MSRPRPGIATLPGGRPRPAVVSRALSSRPATRSCRTPGDGRRGVVLAWHTIRLVRATNAGRRQSPAVARAGRSARSRSRAVDLSACSDRTGRARPRCCGSSAGCSRHGRDGDARRRAASADWRAARSRAGSRSCRRRRTPRSTSARSTSCLMGRYPHLGPFALEGPDDLAIAREALAATGTAALESRAFLARSAAARSSASSSPARWRRPRTCCCSTSRPRRSTSATSSRSRRCCGA